MTGTADFVLAGVTVVTVAICVVTDVRFGKIFNVVTLPAAIIGLILNIVFGGLGGPAERGLVASLCGFATGFGVFLLSSAFGRILGGGDIKLLMALGAIQGPSTLLLTIIYTALAGGVMAIVVMLWRRDFMAGIRRLLSGLTLRVVARVPIDVSETKSTARLPYAIPIAVGCLIAVFAPNPFAA